MSNSEQAGAAPGKHGLVRLPRAAERLGYSTWTLLRWHGKGWLPLVRTGPGQSVPESFLAMLERSARPARPGRIEAVAAEWFRLNGPAAEGAS